MSATNTTFRTAFVEKTTVATAFAGCSHIKSSKNEAMGQKLCRHVILNTTLEILAAAEFRFLLRTRDGLYWASRAFFDHVEPVQRIL